MFGTSVFMRVSVYREAQESYKRTDSVSRDTHDMRRRSAVGACLDSLTTYIVLSLACCRLSKEAMRQ